MPTRQNMLIATENEINSGKFDNLDNWNAPMRAPSKSNLTFGVNLCNHNTANERLIIMPCDKDRMSIYKLRSVLQKNKIDGSFSITSDAFNMLSQNDPDLLLILKDTNRFVKLDGADFNSTSGLLFLRHADHQKNTLIGRLPLNLFRETAEYLKTKKDNFSDFDV